MSAVGIILFVVILVAANDVKAGIPVARPVGEPRFCNAEGQLCFSYDRASIIGPPRWDNVCRTKFCFHGNNQSPIYINPSNVDYVCGQRLEYIGNPVVESDLRNEGIYPNVNGITDEALLSGVPGSYSNGGYKLTSIHIHFRGGEENSGTEHKVAGRDYDAEMHMVHRRVDVSEDNQNLVEGGRAVVAVFLSTRHGSPSQELNKILDKIDKILEYKLTLCRKFFRVCYRDEYGPEYFEGIRPRTTTRENNNGNVRDINGDNNGDDFCYRFFSKPLRCGNDNENGNGNGYENGNGNGDRNGNDRNLCDSRDDGSCPKIKIEKSVSTDGIILDIHPDMLLPRKRNFFYYYGSLTSPPVSEAIRWQIMDEPIRITRRQLWLLQLMESRVEGEKIVLHGNTRPLQPLNGRSVYGNFCY